MKRFCHIFPQLVGSLALILILSLPLKAQSEPLKVGVLDFPPFYIVKNETDVSGTMADVLRKTLDKAGISYVIKGYPPKRLYKELAEGSVHIWMGIKGVPDYEGKVLYGASQTGEIEIRLYTTADKPLLNSLDDMKGKKIITIRGYGYGGMVTFLNDPKNGITSDPTDGHDLAFKKLIKGRSDYVLDYKQPAEDTISKDMITGLKFSSLKNIKLYFIVSKKAPDAENNMKKIEAAYLTLKKEGTIK